MTADKSMIFYYVPVNEKADLIFGIIHKPRTVTEPGVRSISCSINSGSPKDRRALPICLDRAAVLNFSHREGEEDKRQFSGHCAETGFCTWGFPEFHPPVCRLQWWEGRRDLHARRKYAGNPEGHRFSVPWEGVRRNRRGVRH